VRRAAFDRESLLQLGDAGREMPLGLGGGGLRVGERGGDSDFADRGRGR
jgi:hypothetical protein